MHRPSAQEFLLKLLETMEDLPRISLSASKRS